MFSPIDKLLNRVSMYKLVLYYLIALVAAAIGLNLTGVLHYSAVSIAISTTILVGACWAINEVFAGVFDAPTNVESAYITGLILALIISPMANGSWPQHIAFLLAASGLAMASKYILTINKKHIFNPAAVAVALTALGPHQSADWWVGTAALLPFVIIGGVLLVRKIRRGRMVAIFFISTLAATTLYTLLAGHSVPTALHQTLANSAMFFLGFVMLTEPITTPPTAMKQSWYAVLTGFLFPPQFHLLSLYSTPELALVGSNIFSYLISPKTKLFPSLKQKIRVTPDSADFVFATNIRKFNYQPGQYMEWTLPHYDTDNRGNRRYFTLASSPTEKDIRIGIKFYDHGSSFKQAMLNMEADTTIVAAQLSGDFVMPKDPQQKLVFIAGGIGVTPFRSMVKYLIDTNQRRSVTLLYAARTKEDFAYKDIFEQAITSIGMKVRYVISDGQAANGANQRSGRIDGAMIAMEVPDYLDRTFYISGTHAMVRDMQRILTRMEVPRNQIKTDYFSGYV
jgi:ferredoxin-NADP reductase/Na+-translocating ferredoxin:NAD+ oxidoreductase RnfD subunit